MEIVKVRATLKLASQEDVFHGNETYENKMLFLRDQFTKEFLATYKIQSIDNRTFPYHSKEYKEMICAGNKYVRDELNELLQKKMLYKIAESHNSVDIQVKLILRTADEFDFFQNEKYFVPNVIYYIKVNDHELTGPHMLPFDASILHTKTALLNGKLFVPHKRQTFEEIKTAIAS